MDERAQMTVAHLDGAEKQPDGTQTATHGEDEFTARVLRSLPRLREIAIQAALLGPIILSSNAYGGGVRGC